MLETPTSPQARRAQLRAGLASGRLLRFPGAFNALSAALIEEIGFDGVYVSGAVVAASLGLPDIGLTSVSEVVSRGAEIARMTTMPVLIDADTGFGEPMNAARTVQLLEDAGLAACHIEDQVMPKRCGHLDGKSVVATEEMVRRIKGAVAGRRDPDFVVVARTDARSIEGVDAAIARAQAYVEAGADVIFPEALADEHEFERFRRALEVPILANMTEFGVSPLLSAETLASLGVNIVIYPVTALRLAMSAVETGLRSVYETGTQVDLLDRMQHRARLYELLDYGAYNVFDEKIFNFTVPGARDTPAGS
jgi:methylisocitrate lyase